jgi:hypothetical protein
MRRAAGTLMIILGTIMGTFVALVELALGEGSMNYARFILFPIIPAVFVITGGVLCLKRKYWILCFTSSLVLLLLDLYLFLAFNFRSLNIPLPLNSYPLPSATWFPPSFLDWVFTLSGILPIIFVCLRKREWQEIRRK